MPVNIAIDNSDTATLVTRRYSDAGIRLGGGPDSDIIMTPAAYPRFLEGGMGIGTSYQDGLWREGHMTIKDFTKKRIKARMLDKPRVTDPSQQSIKNAPKVAKIHYDAGNNYYGKILDPLYRQYSCARYDKGARSLQEAQLHKLLWTGEKQNLAEGQRVLDVGCGFGGALRFYHERWGVRGTGVTLSAQQASYARDRNRELSLIFLEQDYRKVSGQFDRIVSIGMFEHVGKAHQRTFFEKTKSLLSPGGNMLLHAIFGRFEGGMDPWLEANIFPGGELPTRKEVERSFAGLFVPMDWHRIGESYAPTLMAWNANLRGIWHELCALGYDERFLRTQDYYQQDCAGRFEAGIITVYQIHLFHEWVAGYQPVR